jgi:signal transduction histidine kinase
MHSNLADFIERHASTIVEGAVTFASTVELRPPLDDAGLRNHLPEIIDAIVADLRQPQTRDEGIEKSYGRAPEDASRARSAAGTHALHRAHSGYSISNLVAEYRALRASVLRLWADASPGSDPEVLEQIARFNEAIDQAISESVAHYATEVERWRAIFLGVVGHDLRSPLSAILMTSELIARMAMDAPIAIAAQRLIRSGERMRDLLDNLLVYNRAQIGVGFDIQRQDTDLVVDCREEVELLQAAMPGIEIHFQAPPHVAGSFDASRIREALANLVVNAHKYGTRGADIRVQLRADDTDIALSVINLGAPIPSETLHLMFDPLRRGGVNGGEAEHASLGLGLFIVDQVAKAHGGRIEGHSDQGETTFTLWLPRT